MGTDSLLSARARLRGCVAFPVRAARFAEVASNLIDYPYAVSRFTGVCARAASSYSNRHRSATPSKLYHRQVCEFSFHRAKLAFPRYGTLDDKRAGDTRFARIADFLETAHQRAPHDLFRRICAGARR